MSIFVNCFSFEVYVCFLRMSLFSSSSSRMFFVLFNSLKCWCCCCCSSNRQQVLCKDITICEFTQKYFFILFFFYYFEWIVTDWLQRKILWTILCCCKSLELKLQLRLSFSFVSAELVSHSIVLKLLMSLASQRQLKQAGAA